MNVTTYPNVYHGTLLDEIIHEQKLSADLVKRAAREVFVIIKEGLLRDGMVRINHFGTFKLKRVAARQGNNPQTGKPITIAGHAKVIFSPCKALRELIEPNHAKPMPLPLSVTEPIQPREPLQPVSKLTSAAALLKSESEVRSVIERVSDISEEPPKGHKRGNYEKIIYFSIAATIIALVIIKSMPRKTAPPQHLTAPIVTEMAMVAPMVVTELELKPEKKSVVTETELVPAGVVSTEVAGSGVVEPEAESELAQIIASQSAQPAEQRVELEVAVTPEQAAPMSVDESVAKVALITDVVEPVEIVATETPAIAASPAEAVDQIPVATTEFFFTERPHKLESGNSLWRLSERYYSEPLYWPHIFFANAETVTNPDKLFIGRTIAIPTLEGGHGHLTINDREGIAEGYFLTYLYYKESGHKDAFFALLEAKRYSAEVVERKRHTLKLSAVENILLDQQEVVANL